MPYIFQTWKTSEIPEQWYFAHESIICMNPNWQVVLLTDEDNLRIVRENFPDFYDTFVGFPYSIQKADAIRYIILYLYGGIYIDLDFEAIQSFDNLVFTKNIGLIKSANGKYITNCFMVAKTARDPFWIECISEMKKKEPWWAISKHLKVFCTTGPFMLQRIYKKHKDKIDILEISVPCDICKIKRCYLDEKYYVKPIPGGSWNEWDSIFYNWIYCNWILLLFFIFILALLIIGYRDISQYLHKVHSSNFQIIDQKTRHLDGK